LKLFIVLITIVGLGFLQMAGGQTPSETQEVLATGYAKDTILVKFIPDLDKGEKNQILSSFGMEEARRFDQIGVGVYRISHQVPALVKELNALPQVQYAEPNYLRKTSFTPNDPQFGSQWGFKKIQAEQAWDITMGDNNIIVAVIDTGIDQDHPDLVNQRWINVDEIAGNNKDDDNNGYVDDRYGYDFFGTALFGILPPPESDEDSDPEDDNGHGSHTSGTIAAQTNNNIGVAGSATHCKVMVLRALGGFLGFGYSSDIIAAMLYAADNGAHIISMSLGSEQYAQAELTACKYVYGFDILIVAAAGNGGNSVLNYPAGYPQVLAVGATTSSDTIASFSTRGANLEVSAPGQNILSTWKGGGYQSSDGTSMACPHVAGLAALIRSKFPGLMADNVRQLIHDSAQDLGATGWDMNFGQGRINAYQALTEPVNPGVSLFTPGDGSQLNSGAQDFGLCWSQVKNATQYGIIFQLPNGVVVPVLGLNSNIFNFPTSLAPAGKYKWCAGAVTTSGAVFISNWWEFNK